MTDFPIFNLCQILRKSYLKDKTISEIRLLKYDGTEKSQEYPFVFRAEVTEQPKHSTDSFSRCIPLGRYMIGWTWTSSHEWQWTIKNVPNFSDVFLTFNGSGLINSPGAIRFDSINTFQGFGKVFQSIAGEEPRVMTFEVIENK